VKDDPPLLRVPLLLPESPIDELADGVWGKKQAWDVQHNIARHGQGQGGTAVTRFHGIKPRSWSVQAFAPDRVQNIEVPFPIGPW
jgi:hypothetical protein